MSKSNYKDYMRYYSNTSEAYDLKKEPRQRKNKAKTKTKGKQKQKPKGKMRKPSLVVKYIEDGKMGISPYWMVTLIIIFIGVISVVVLSATIDSGRATNIALQKELKKLNEANQTLQVEISNSYDLAQIEKIATSRLRMSRPKSDQIVHISIPKQSFMIVHKPIKDKTSIEKLLEFASELFSKFDPNIVK